MNAEGPENNAEGPENEEPKPVPLILPDSQFPYPADAPAAKLGAMDEVILSSRAFARGVDAAWLSENGTIRVVQAKHWPARAEPPSSEFDRWIRSRLRWLNVWSSIAMVAGVGGLVAMGIHANAAWGLASVLVMIGTAGGMIWARIGPPRFNTHVGRFLADFSARGLTGVAARLAGRRRAAVGAEWRTHLAGYGGHDPATWDKVPQALGFVGSAIQYRYSDVTNTAWSLIEAVLKSRLMSNVAVWLPTLILIDIVFRRDGLLGVITNAENLAVPGGLLYALIRLGRRWRGVKPPPRKPRQAKE